jgi:hypothetical protein
VVVPFPNEHAARQNPPNKYQRFRRGKLSGAPKGVSVIWGITSAGKTEIQSIRFDVSLWTADRAKSWLKKHGFKTAGFEQASSKVDWSGVV